MADLRNIWVDNLNGTEEERLINKVLRIFSNRFLKREAIVYII